MVSLLLVLSIVGIVIWGRMHCKNKNSDAILGALICACLAMFFLAWMFKVCYDVGIKQTIIEQKIAMYQEENQTIEERIDSLVKNYMEYEADTYEQFKNESSTELISLFPELKSDELVIQQMQLYNENKVKITALKSELIDMAGNRWLLYFGK